MQNSSKKSIVLIGMPGSGKSKIADILSIMLKMQAIDIDYEITLSKQKTISLIFEEEGEEEFRKCESLLCIELSEKKNIIISTGGGIILDSTNISHLSKNGIIFFLDRSLGNILNSADLSDRPLVQNNRERLTKLYNERIELYKEYADYIIENNSSLEEAANQIIKIYKQIQ